MVNRSTIAAFFDVDHTLVRPYSMEKIFIYYLIQEGFITSNDLVRYVKYLIRNIFSRNMKLVKKNKYYLQDKDSNELIYLASNCFKKNIFPLISPIGRKRIVQHRAFGHLVVLLTGTLQILADFLADELKVDIVLAAELEILANGRLSGLLSNHQPYGREKANLIQELAQKYLLDLSNSYCYGDHYSDRYVLSIVGNPYAVNPHPLLRWEAFRREWPVLIF